MAEEKKPAPKKAVKKDDKKKGGFGQWLHDMKGEMKKIVWPTKEVRHRDRYVRQRGRFPRGV